VIQYRYIKHVISNNDDCAIKNTTIVSTFLSHGPALLQLVFNED